jgi:hypothetical protein
MLDKSQAQYVVQHPILPTAVALPVEQMRVAQSSRSAWSGLSPELLHSYTSGTALFETLRAYGLDVEVSRAIPPAVRGTSIEPTGIPRERLTAVEKGIRRYVPDVGSRLILNASCKDQSDRVDVSEVLHLECAQRRVPHDEASRRAGCGKSARPVR